jgi:acyl-CoA thioesterase II
VTVETLLARLDIEKIDRDLFRGFSPDDGRPRVFGGQVAAQALVAAVRTVEDRPVHSLHSYFLRPGDPKIPIIYEVDRIRDGKSFTTRRVVAIQNGEAIFNMAASFQKNEPGLDHQDQMPAAPPPESVPSYQELIERRAASDPFFAKWAKHEHPILIHDLDPIDPTRPRAREGEHLVWWKADGELPDELVLHQCVLAYASDYTLLDASLHRHARSWLSPDMMVASIDHAIWFHRPFRADDWLLYATDSPSASGGRGLNLGRIYSKEGTLVASVAQESLMRVLK